MTRKPTADERDREIVAKAGPWFLSCYGCPVPSWDNLPGERDYDKACDAALRILQRIVREEAKRGK